MRAHRVQEEYSGYLMRLPDTVARFGRAGRASGSDVEAGQRGREFLRVDLGKVDGMKWTSLPED
jgi:hypothetical protein